MPFNYLLTNLLVDIPEAIGAVFLDEEGETIECVTRNGDPYQLKVEGAYHSIFKRRMEDAVRDLSLGSLNSYTIAGENLTALTQVLPEGYYVVLVLDRDGSQGKARFHLHRAAKVIERELV